MSNEHSELSSWADRIRRERDVRGWSPADAVAALRTFSDVPLPGGLIDQWTRWEGGGNKPDEFYRPLIAATFGTVVESIFPGSRPPLPSQTNDERLLSRCGIDTHELVQRIGRSSVDATTLAALELTVEQLCCEYSGHDATQLIAKSREWLSRITCLLDERLTLVQRKHLLDTAGWLTLLIGCLEYDTGQYRAAEAARTRAMQLADDATNASLLGWAHELRAWFALTNGRYREVLEAAHAGQDAAPGRSVSVQLLAQEAKAWARMTSQRNALRALEKGRVLLDSLPYPEQPANHFVVEPDKFEFYAMDCYRLVGDDHVAEMLAREIIKKSITFDDADISPMRRAEAELTLGIIAARNGAVDDALSYGHKALTIDRRSQPTLLMVGFELHHALRQRYPNNADVQHFHQCLTDIAATTSTP